MSASLPVMDLGDNPTGCCPRFKPEPWNGQEFGFEGLRFALARTKSFFYMPRDMDAVMTRAQAAIDEVGAAPKDRYLILSRDDSPFRASHRFLVTKEVPGMESAAVEGTWFAKVFEGPFNRIGTWYRELNAELAAKGRKVSDFLAFYTTCPNCAKAYGKNYVVLFARVG